MCWGFIGMLIRLMGHLFTCECFTAPGFLGKLLDINYKTWKTFSSLTQKFLKFSKKRIYEVILQGVVTYSVENNCNQIHGWKCYSTRKHQGLHYWQLTKLQEFLGAFQGLKTILWQIALSGTPFTRAKKLARHPKILASCWWFVSMALPVYTTISGDFLRPEHGACNHTGTPKNLLLCLPA